MKSALAFFSFYLPESKEQNGLKYSQKKHKEFQNPENARNSRCNREGFLFEERRTQGDDILLYKRQELSAVAFLRGIDMQRFFRRGIRRVMGRIELFVAFTATVAFSAV